jgi:hypothetical protein
MIKSSVNRVLALVFVTSSICGFSGIVSAQESAQTYWGGYNAFRVCMLTVNSRAAFNANMKARGHHEFTNYELEPKNTVLQKIIKIDGNSVSAWSDTQTTFTSLWAKVRVFDGKKWQSANMCFVHSNIDALNDMMEWSSLFRDLATKDKPAEHCCYDMPSYSSHLTVFEDHSPVKKVVDNISKYEWTRYTVIFANGFNKQFQPLKQVQ